METATKEQIVTHLRKFCDKSGSSNAASKKLNNVSVATISNMLNGKWDSMSDDLWRNVESQVCITGWVTVPTKASKTLIELFDNSKEYANVFGIVGDAGIGKTHISRQYAQENENVYVVRCNEYFNRKTFLADLLRAMHKDSGGYTVAEMMNTVVKEIRKADKPLIIMDEVDKLNDQVFYFIITLYNFLEGQCGIIIMATDHLEKRVKRGLSLNKKGYKEIYSRIGRKWITLKTPSTKDITAIVKANGIDDENAIASIINDAESDLRRVERLVHAEKLAA